MSEFKVKILNHLEKGQVELLGSDEKVRKMYTDKGLTTALEVGKDYNITVEQKQSKAGFKYNIIVKAVPVQSVNTSKQVYTPKTTSVNTTPKSVSTNTDKMTKEDWAKKELDIKWLTCVKASAEFNAHRPDIDINKVLSDARTLFDYNNSQAILPIENESEVL